MRAYKAARRAALKEPVQFAVDYERPKEHRDDRGRMTGTTVEAAHDVFTCRGDISALMLSELAAQSDLDAASPEGMALLRGVFWQAFGDGEEYQRFFKVATAYLDDDELFDIMGDLVEDMSGRPTMSPPASPEPPATAPDSGPPSPTASPGGLPTGSSHGPHLHFEAGQQSAQPAVTARRASLQRGTIETLAAPTAEQLAADREVAALEHSLLLQ